MVKASASLSSVIGLAAEVIDEKTIKTRLASGKKLRVKLGIDPTSPRLHIGFAVPLRMLRIFQDAGHQAVLIIGDFTAQIGDPAERETSRRRLSAAETKSNQHTYLGQIAKILNLKKTEVHKNSEWFSKMKIGEFLGLLSNFSLRTAWEREDFQKRLKSGREVRLHEAMYSVLQGYDSVAIGADIEIGALDQKLNLLAGRGLQRALGQTPQEIVMFPYLIGLDGKNKMSKSIGNTIDLTDSAPDMFGKVMSVPDGLITHYARLAAWMPEERVKIISRDLNKSKNPRDCKLDVAEAVVALYHGRAAAADSRREFIKLFSRKLLSSSVAAIKLELRPYKPIELLLVLGACRSKSEARRLLAGGALEINNRVIESHLGRIAVGAGDVIRVGKKKFFRVR